MQLADQMRIASSKAAHLPRQAALQQEEQRVRQRLEVVAARRCAAQMRMHTCVPHSPPEDIRALVVLYVRAAHKVFPPRSCTAEALVSKRARLLQEPGCYWWGKCKNVVVAAEAMKCALHAMAERSNTKFERSWQQQEKECTGC